MSATPTPTPGQIQPGLAGGGRSQRDQLGTPQPLIQLPACRMCILVTELLLPKLGKGRVPDSLRGEDCLSFCGQAAGWARLPFAVVQGGEGV